MGKHPGPRRRQARRCRVGGGIHHRQGRHTRAWSWMSCSNSAASSGVRVRRVWLIACTGRPWSLLQARALPTGATATAPGLSGGDKVDHLLCGDLVVFIEEVEAGGGERDPPIPLSRPPPTQQQSG